MVFFVQQFKKNQLISSLSMSRKIIYRLNWSTSRCRCVDSISWNFRDSNWGCYSCSERCACGGWLLCGCSCCCDPWRWNSRALWIIKVINRRWWGWVSKTWASSTELLAFWRRYIRYYLAWLECLISHFLFMLNLIYSHGSPKSGICGRGLIPFCSSNQFSKFFVYSPRGSYRSASAI